MTLVIKTFQTGQPTWRQQVNWGESATLFDEPWLTHNKKRMTSTHSTGRIESIVQLMRKALTFGQRKYIRNWPVFNSFMSF